MSDSAEAGAGTLRHLTAAARAILEDATRRNPMLEGASLVAIGWATVDAERAVAELGAALGSAPDDDRAWQSLRRDAVLGATVVCWRGPEGPRPLILVEEPDREGRLAASLARQGEGVAAIYVVPAAGSIVPTAALGRSSVGPVGRARGLVDPRLGSPTVVLLDQDPAAA